MSFVFEPSGAAFPAQGLTILVTCDSVTVMILTVSGRYFGGLVLLAGFMF